MTWGIFCLSVVTHMVSFLNAQEPGEYWSAAEKQKIQKFWMDGKRYSVSNKSPYVVRLTADGSTWLWEYNRKRGKGKVPPSQVPAPANEQEAIWEKWIEAKVAFDRNSAAVEAAKLSKTNLVQLTAPNPGSPPSDLVEKFGAPPEFAKAVQPAFHEVKFDEVTLSYEDNVDMRPRYAYYRFENGVMAAGTRMKSLPPREVDSILKKAGISESESKVLKAVSLLEGGFDSVNTYDTGFVSIGFIQFASLKDGSHSLGQTLLEYKQTDPENFDADFHRFGLDVDDKGTLVALDVNCLLERVGAEANTQIIRDKWLTAAFQRAGQRMPYRLAQLKVAKRMYWPLGDMVSVNIAGKEVKTELSKLFRSEAGAAVLLDRKVNTGGYGPLKELLQLVVDSKEIKSVDELRNFEALFIECLWYRFNPVNDETLDKPAPCEMLPTVLKKYRPSK